MSTTIKFAAIMKEQGVSDLKASLGLRVAAAFAKALHMEREAGHTTQEAWDQLLVAIDYEQAALQAQAA
jgi:hypothetical protein